MDMIDMRTLYSQALVTDRLDRGMSQQALSEALGVVQQSLSKWEKGQTLPRDYRMRQAADFFGPESRTAGALEDILSARASERSVSISARRLPPASGSPVEEGTDAQEAGQAGIKKARDALRDIDRLEIELMRSITLTNRTAPSGDVRTSIVNSLLESLSLLRQSRVLLSQRLESFLARVRKEQDPPQE